MKAIGTVCEYNPFHSGHEYHLRESLRRAGVDCALVGVMSGDFVQRGEAAIFDKYARAEAACRCGADVIFELPLPWCLSSAEGFARGTVKLLKAAGVSWVSFGVETEDALMLRDAARWLLNEDNIEKVKESMRQAPELSFAAARQRAMENDLGSVSEVLASPNNILAVEYIKAIMEYAPDLDIIPVKRRGNGHDSRGAGDILSASQLREMLRAGEDIAPFVPKAAMEIYEREIKRGRCLLNHELLEVAMLSRLRWMRRDGFDALPDGGDGLGMRLYSAVHSEATLVNIEQSTKTKRYAMSRVRRLIMCAVLGVNKDAASQMPPYLRVLAATEKGCKYLGELRGKTALPIITRAADIKKIGGAAETIFTLSADAHDLYILDRDDGRTTKPGEDWRYSTVIVQN